MYEKGIFVGFQINCGPTFGLVAGQSPRSQIHFVRVMAPIRSRGIWKVPLENLSILGQAGKNESDEEVLEKYCRQIISFLIGDLSMVWEHSR